MFNSIVNVERYVLKATKFRLFLDKFTTQELNCFVKLGILKK